MLWGWSGAAGQSSVKQSWRTQERRGHAVGRLEVVQPCNKVAVLVALADK
jgi:hypothetical protein